MESLASLLDRYRRRPEPELARKILSALADSRVYVPVSLGRSAGTPVQQDAFGLKPDTIPGPEGKVLFPAFSNQGQIPSHYGARFSFLHLPFAEFCAAACSDPRLCALVLDPFTAKFIVPEDAARSLLDSGSSNQ